MSAKEYYSDVFIYLDMPDDTIADFASSLITMNHKTIEDVERLIPDIDTLKNDHLKMWLIQFKAELEKMKI